MTDIFPYCKLPTMKNGFALTIIRYISSIDKA